MVVVYACAYAIFGVLSPFAPIWFAIRGYSATEIGLLIATPLLARAVTAPILAQAVRRWGPRSVLRLVGFVAAVAMFTVASLPKSIVIAPLWVVTSCGLQFCGPLLDVLTFPASGNGRLIYGHLRAVGSASYVGATLVVGVLVGLWDSRVIPIWICVFSLGLSALASILPTKVTESIAPLPLLIGLDTKPGSNRTIILLTASVSGLVLASHGFYALAPIVWRAQGFSSAAVGALWSIGVVADFLILLFGQQFRSRVAPERILILGSVAAMMRWALYSTSPGLLLIVAGQLAHAVTLTSVLYASLQLIHRFSSDGRFLTNQAANWGIGTGLLLGASQLLSSWLYSTIHAVGYLIMILPAFFGLLLSIALSIVIATRQTAASDDAPSQLY